MNMTRARSRPFRVVAAAGLVVAISLGLWIGAETHAAEESSAQSSRSTRASSTSGSETGDDAIIQKLNQVLAKQATILQRLDEVMEELKIVKIRATVNR